MTRSTTQFLRLYSERQESDAQIGSAVAAPIQDACRAFSRATGWPLHMATGDEPHDDSRLAWSAPLSADDAPAAELRMERTADANATSDALPFEAARELAETICALATELVRFEHALRRREAELAAGVPVVPQADGQRHLVERIEAVLRGGATAVGCQAAALYLLDDATTELKLRAAWGLPSERLVEPPRALRTARADLEALCGHAVVIDDTTLLPHWNLPEEFPAAVCVPVSSPTVPLGTLWLFAGECRDFDERQVNLIEMIAGRIAADLEREMLCAEGSAALELRRQVMAAETFQDNQRPRIAPEIDGWDVAGWSSAASGLSGLSGDFYDWFMTDDARLGLVVGDTVDRGIAGAMSANGVRALARAYGSHSLSPKSWIERTSAALWTSSCGDQMTALWMATVDQRSGVVHFTMAGQVTALWIGKHNCQSLVVSALEAGVDPAPAYQDLAQTMSAGDVLIAATDGLRDAADSSGRALGETAIAEAVRAARGARAADIVDAIRDRLEEHLGGAARGDCAMLVLRRR